jgi:hypothetical protein
MHHNKNRHTRTSTTVEQTSVKPWKVLGYKTQKQLIEHIRTVITDMSIGDTVSAPVILDVLKLHHHYAQKVGAGIKQIVVRLNYKAGFKPTRGLWIERNDGTWTDISWTSCLKPDGGRTPDEDAVAAARQEVYGQIEAFRAKGHTVCGICGKDIVGDIHVDHAVQFNGLFTDWLAVQNLQAGDIAVTDEGISSSFSDPKLRQSWQDFHRNAAVLRATHALCNLSRKRTEQVAQETM